MPQSRRAACAIRVTHDRLAGTCNRTMAEVPLDAIQPFDRLAALARDQKLEEFGVRPDEGHGSARRPAGGEPELGDGVGVPNLLGEEAPHARAAAHRLEIGQGILAALQREVPPLADEQRPAAPDALPVEWAPVGVLAVAVAIVAMVERAGRSLDLQDMIDHANRILHAGVERSEEHTY